MKKTFCIIGGEPFIMQIYNEKIWISYGVNFIMGTDGSLVMQFFIIGIDGSIIMQNCQDRMDYVRG